MGKMNAKGLASDFYGGAFGQPAEQSGRKLQRVYSGSMEPSEPTVFDDATYEAAIEKGYGTADINSFLRESGIKATGSNFRVAGMGDYQGRRDVFWEVAPLPKSVKAKTNEVKSNISTISSVAVSSGVPTSLILPDPLTNVRIN